MHDGLEAWLRAAAERIHEEAPALTALDQAIGDGDHGINMDRGFAAIVAMLDAREAPAADAPTPPRPPTCSGQAGKTLISTVGGASGPLYGTAFLRGAGGARAASIRRLRRRSSPRSRPRPAGSPPSARPPRARRRCSTRSSRPPAAARAALDGGGDLAGGRRRPRTTPPRPAPRPRSRCSRPRVGRRISASAASGTRIPARPRRRCCSASSRPPRRRTESGAMSRADARRAPGVAGRRRGRLLWLSPIAGAGRSAPPRRANGAILRPASGRKGTAAWRRFAAAATELAALAAETASRAGDEIGAIFEAQALFAADPGIVEPAIAAIDAGASAAEAIDRVTAEQADVLAGVDDEYFRERAADLRDVGRRVVDHLLGRERPELHHRDGAPAIVASDDLDPSIVAVIRPELVAGLALAGGAPSGHAAIVARALGHPARPRPRVPRSTRASTASMSRSTGTPAGSSSTRPTRTSRRSPPRRRSRPCATGGGAGVPCLSVRRGQRRVGPRGGGRGRAGAMGIGLVRTELLFLGRSAPPGLDEQRALYRRIAAALPGGPVVFRTLDIGGDKPAAYLPGRAGDEPGARRSGLRLGLNRPEAASKPSFGRSSRPIPARRSGILLPMVATVEEVAGRATRDRGSGRGVAPSRGGGRRPTSGSGSWSRSHRPRSCRRLRPDRRLLQHRDERPRPVHAGRRSHESGPGRARDAAPAGGPPPRPDGHRGGRALPPPGRGLRRGRGGSAAAALLVGLGVDELSVAPGSLATPASVTRRHRRRCLPRSGRASDGCSDRRRGQTIAAGLAERPMATAGSPAA